MLLRRQPKQHTALWYQASPDSGFAAVSVPGGVLPLLNFYLAIRLRPSSRQAETSQVLRQRQLQASSSCHQRLLEHGARPTPVSQSGRGARCLGDVFFSRRRIQMQGRGRAPRAGPRNSRELEAPRTPTTRSRRQAPPAEAACITNPSIMRVLRQNAGGLYVGRGGGKEE
jgi:hypothetical protein